ncbi:MAG: cysteine desulfurase-like protein [Acidobacteria bacterium]|nr:cysteine desulfurase-like protein [Acidobacteriota bacterium]
MFDVARIRSRFPSLSPGVIFLDNPGGTQVAQGVIDEIARYFRECNANHGGAFRTSRISDALVAETRSAVASFLNAASPDEVVFGQNMTSLTFHLSRSLASRLAPGDEVVVTRLDHDANVSPWTLIARDRGAVVRWVDFDPDSGRWDLDSLARELSGKTRIVALGWASNALGTINPVKEAVRLARQAGAPPRRRALTFIDAVHYAPHGPIDVKDVGCDFLACSGYKFFGPHIGILWGRHELLEELPAYKVRPSGNHAPDKWETGTQSFESITGTLGALRHIAGVGDGQAGTDRAALLRGMLTIQEYEKTLTRALLTGLGKVPGLTLYGPREVDGRAPTFSFTLEGYTPRQVTEELDRAGIYAWDGNYYALGVTERLGLEDRGGMVRVGAVHYNTEDEIDRLVGVLVELSRRKR